MYSGHGVPLMCGASVCCFATDSVVEVVLWRLRWVQLVDECVPVQGIVLLLSVVAAVGCKMAEHECGLEVMASGSGGKTLCRALLGWIV